MTDYLAMLAEAMVRCPNCEDDDNPNLCSQCHGSGRVPLVPGLWKTAGLTTFRGKHPVKSLVSHAEAVVALLDYCHDQLMTVVQNDKNIEPAKRYSVLPRFNRQGQNANGDTLAEAVARALRLEAA